MDFIYLYTMLRIELNASHMLGRRSTTKPPPQPQMLAIIRRFQECSEITFKSEERMGLERMPGLSTHLLKEGVFIHANGWKGIDRDCMIRRIMSELGDLLAGSSFNLLIAGN